MLAVPGTIDVGTGVRLQAGGSGSRMMSDSEGPFSDRLRSVLNRRAIWYAALAVLSLGAGLLVWRATRWGIGVGYDSYFYLTAAQNLKLGHGLGRFTAEGMWAPLTHYPSMYPIILSGLSSLFSIEVSASARILSAVLMSANVAGFAALMSWGTGRWWLSLLGASIFAAAPIVLEQHLWAMSEPLFFALLLAFVYSLARYQLEPNRLRWLAVGGVIGSLAYLSRYAGLALLAAGLLTIILAAGGGWRSRLRDGFIFVVTIMLVTGPWLLRNAALTGSLTNRNLRLHPLTLDQIKQGGLSVADWIGPMAIPPELRLGIVVVLLTAIVFDAGRRALKAIEAPTNEGNSAALRLVWVSIALLYPLALLLSLTFFDASTRLNDRILSPLFITFLALALLTVTDLRRLARVRWPGLLVVLILFLIPFAVRSGGVIAAANQTGLGFNGKSWRQSPTVHAVSTFPSDAVIYSNEAFPLSYRTGRDIFPVPERFDPVLASEREDYRDQLGTMRSRLMAGNGFLALFHPEQLRVEMPSLEEITEGMVLVDSYRDGDIYRPKTSDSTAH